MLSAILPLAVVAATASLVHGMPTFPAKLPNGANVPGVKALGHIDTNGGGKNNQFGLDFAAAGKEWTTKYCQMDSDGDGQTNGQELGDPCCEWNEDDNAVVLWTKGVSHPGNASLTSDPSLWASVTCGSSSSSSSGVVVGSDAAGDASDSNSKSDSEKSTSAAGDATSSSTSAAPATAVTAVAAAGLAVAMALLA